MDLSRIIVCDDQTDTALTLAELLRLYGYEVFACFDGDACLKKAQGWLPYAAIIDIGLPGITGYDVARGFRALPGGGNVVLIAVTGYGKHDDLKEARLADFDWHFNKPAPPSSIIEVLRDPDSSVPYGTRF